MPFRCFSVQVLNYSRPLSSEINVCYEEILVKRVFKINKPVRVLNILATFDELFEGYQRDTEPILQHVYQ